MKAEKSPHCPDADGEKFHCQIWKQIIQKGLQSLMPFPAYHENQAKVVVKIDATLGVSASCKHLEAVEQFLDYVFSKNVSEYYADKAGAYSCIKSVDVEDSYAKAFTDSIRSGEFFLEEFAYETEKSDAINALFQNFISSPQRDTEKSFLKELNDLLIQQKGD